MGDGEFWQPPMKSEGFKDLEDWEREAYISQTKELWDRFAQKLPTDIFASITTPEPSGYYGFESEMCGEVDDGVLAVYVLMTRYRPQDNEHVTGLKEFMAPTPLLVQSSRANVAKVVEKIKMFLKEILTLGVRIPWASSGEAFAETLIAAQPKYSHHIHQYRLMATDPEDSAPAFQSLLVKVKAAYNAVIKQDKRQGSGRELLFAYNHSKGRCVCHEDEGKDDFVRRCVNSGIPLRT